MQSPLSPCHTNETPNPTSINPGTKHFHFAVLRVREKISCRTACIFFFFFLAAGRFHPMFTSFTGLQQPETFGWDSGLSSTTDNNAAECCLCQKASTSDNEDWYIIEQSLELQFLNLFHDI